MSGPGNATPAARCPRGDTARAGFTRTRRRGPGRSRRPAPGPRSRSTHPFPPPPEQCIIDSGKCAAMAAPDWVAPSNLGKDSVTCPVFPHRSGFHPSTQPTPQALLPAAIKTSGPRVAPTPLCWGNVGVSLLPPGRPCAARWNTCIYWINDIVKQPQRLKPECTKGLLYKTAFNIY